ncbi:MAG: hypothetical protein MRK02_13420 [Candidatus Scalindua sp.]|nr:hypothetical protein [Candidatus Scalindua sp.]
MVIICCRDEAEISQLEHDEQKDFLIELGLEESSMEWLTRTRLSSKVDCGTV